jgi:hypothetical protein
MFGSGWLLAGSAECSPGMNNASFAPKQPFCFTLSALAALASNILRIPELSQNENKLTGIMSQSVYESYRSVSDPGISARSAPD